MKNVCSDNHKSAPVDKNITTDVANTTEKYCQALLTFERLGDDARDAIWRTHKLGDVLRMPTTEFLTKFEEISSAPRCGQIWENREKRVVVFYVNSKNTVFYYTVSGMGKWMNITAFLDTYSYTGRICETAERFLQDFQKLQTEDWASVGENVYDSVAPHEYNSAPQTGGIWRRNSDNKKVIIGATWHHHLWTGIDVRTYNCFDYSSADFCSDSVEVRTNDICSDNTVIFDGDGYAFLKNHSFTGYKYETMVSFIKELKELKQNGDEM